MARATRSAHATAPATQKTGAYHAAPAATTPVVAGTSAVAGNGKKKGGAANGLPKKRKRPSNAELDADIASDDDDALGPPTKQPRPEPTYPLAADSPLSAVDAQRILNVLEAIDPQGLLDRAYPPDEPSSSSHPPRSLRDLLLDAHNQTLRTIKNAIQLLYPVTSHVRSRNAPAADQQLHFCKLALELLDQASLHTNTTTRLSLTLEDGENPAFTGSVGNKYALMQKLPNGDWWSSALASDDPHASLSAKQSRALIHGQAELVLALPSVPELDASENSAPRTTLANFAPGPLKKRATRNREPARKSLPSCSFLDYGPWASFAPSFDADAADFGRDDLAVLLDTRAKARSERLRRLRIIREQILAESTSAHDSMEVDLDTTTRPTASSASQFVLDPTLLAADSTTISPGNGTGDTSAALLEQTVVELEREMAITTLIQSNARALSDLQVMQMHRLKSGDNLDTTGPENQTAQQVFETLELLTSLRPRGESNETSSVISHPDALHAAQLALPHTTTTSWKGTLAEGRSAALRDNHTVRVKVASSAAASTTSKPTITTPASNPPAGGGQGSAPGTPVGYPRPPYGYPAMGYYPPNAQFAAALGTPPVGSPAAAPAYPYPYYGGGFVPYPYPPPGSAGQNTKAIAAEAAKYYAYAGGPQGGAIPNAAKTAPGAAGAVQNGWMAMGYPPAPGTPQIALPPHMRPSGKFVQYPASPTPAGR